MHIYIQAWNSSFVGDWWFKRVENEWYLVPSSVCVFVYSKTYDYSLSPPAWTTVSLKYPKQLICSAKCLGSKVEELCSIIHRVAVDRANL